MLEEKKKELADAIQAVISKEREIDLLVRERLSEIAEFNRKKTEGMTVIDAGSHERHIRVLQKSIDDREEELKRLVDIESEKKNEVVSARQEVMALEKLRDKRITEYNLALLKEEETLIEEIVSNQRSNSLTAQRQGAQ